MAPLDQKVQKHRTKLMKISILTRCLYDYTIFRRTIHSFFPKKLIVLITNTVYGISESKGLEALHKIKKKFIEDSAK